MQFRKTRVAGAYVVEPHKIQDERGFFARAWCANELRDAGLAHEIAQSNMAENIYAATLRGLHLQRAPFEEVKFVRCVRGAIFDVVVDLRTQSPTYLAWDGVELSQDNHLALYVPEGCATGYLTLTDGCAMYYHTSRVYTPAAVWGIRYDEPDVGIQWPLEPRFTSQQDRSWPPLAAARGNS